MYSENSKILECSKCHTIFWLSDILAPLSIDMGDYRRYTAAHGHFESALGALCWDKKNNYIRFLKRAPWRTEDEEKYLRIRAWWSWNEFRRKDCQLNDELSQAAAANCERLLYLFDDKDDREAIMRGEVLREPGRFQECLIQLDRHLDDRYTEWILAIQELAENKNPCVKRIKKSELAWKTRNRIKVSAEEGSV